MISRAAALAVTVTFVLAAAGCGQQSTADLGGSASVSSSHRPSSGSESPSGSEHPRSGSESPRGGPNLLPARWTAVPKDPPSVLSQPIAAAAMLIHPRAYVKLEAQAGSEWRDVDQVVLVPTDGSADRLLPGVSAQDETWLSPDGRNVAWVVRSTGAVRLLTLASGTVRSLPIMQLFNGLWFTPDGAAVRWVESARTADSTAPASGALVRYDIARAQVTSREPLAPKVFPIGELGDGTLVLFPLSVSDPRGRVLPLPKALLDWNLNRHSDSGPALYPAAWSDDASRWVMPSNAMVMLPSEMASPPPERTAAQKATVLDAKTLTTTVFDVPGNDGYVTWFAWKGELLYGTVDEPLGFERVDASPAPVDAAVLQGKDVLRKVIRLDLLTRTVTVLAQGPISALPVQVAAGLVN